jgi:uncharacterized protein YjiS (DUF1127 family)
MTLMMTAAAMLARAAWAAKNGWANLETRAARRRTVTALAALDGRTLADIGLRRGEILSVVYGGGLERRRGPMHD